MNGESMDDLIALYRKTARETPLPRIDEHILQQARNTRRAHHRKPHWTWFAAAIAASAVMWLAGHRTVSQSSLSTRASGDDATPGYLEGRNRIYLMSMDIAPPPSPTAQFLLQQGAPSD